MKVAQEKRSCEQMGGMCRNRKEWEEREMEGDNDRAREEMIDGEKVTEGGRGRGGHRGDSEGGEETKRQKEGGGNRGMTKKRHKMKEVKRKAERSKKEEVRREE